MTKEKKLQLSFALIMSMFMALCMSGILTALNTGLSDGFFLRWTRAFLVAWACAFPLVMVFAPLTRKIVGRLFS
jgi:hypothetical protein